jgi:glycosyltransferase involved in cell wall biosynthesis
VPTDQRDDRPIAPLAVIMPTWNAGPYLEPLLDSLAAQTFDDWTLLVRDDGSSDGTLDQLQRRAAADPRIQLLTDSRGHLGAAAGFGLLLMEALHRGAAYVACCDQDDRWHPEKLARQIQSLRATESDLAEATPLLSTCAATLVDANLAPLGQTVTPALPSPSIPTQLPARLLLSNLYPGCTLVLNRALLERALPLPTGVAMHDWWLALVASQTGLVLPLTDPLIDYRQHAGNTVGLGWSLTRWIRKLTRPLHSLRVWRTNQSRALKQSLELALRFGRDPHVPASHRQLLSAWIDVWARRSPRACRTLLFAHGVDLSGRDRWAISSMRRSLSAACRHALQQARLSSPLAIPTGPNSTRHIPSSDSAAPQRRAG